MRYPARPSRWRFTLSLVVALPLACIFDSEEHALDDTYYVGSIDLVDSMSLYHRVNSQSGIRRIGPTVFAAGLDSQFVIVKRHPAGDRSKIEYFLLDRSKDDSPTHDPTTSVSGPFTEQEFAAARARARVSPALQFTLVLRKLQ